MTTETSTIHASFGHWVRRRRKALDLTQDQLADLVSCSYALIRKIESDERRPSPEVAQLLAKALEIAPAERPAFLKVARGERATTALVNIPEPQSVPAERSDLAPPPGLAHLPIPPNPLVGRTAEMATLLNLLQDVRCRLLTITGAGGMGKTRVAIELAHEARREFAHGACFVNLAALAHSESLTVRLATAIATALGFNFSGPAQPELQLATYLHNKQLLLVLDNFEHLLDGAALIGELLARAPALKVLVTSREPLALQAEWVFTISGLAIATTLPNQPDATPVLTSAVQLFVQRASQAQVGFRLEATNQVAVNRICHLVEGMPLALELAATWVRTLTCHEIAQQIEQGVDFLVTTARDLPPRHRSIRAVFDHSWQLLSAPEQQALAQLAVFQGGFTREAAQAVSGASLLLLSALVAKSLVRVNAGRYDLHELVRQYVASRTTAEALLAATQQRHAEYYLELLRLRETPLKSETQLQVVDELKQELDNLHQALEAAGQYALWTPLLRALRCYWAFFDLQGLAREGIEALQPLIQRLETNPDTREKQATLGRLLCYRGLFFYRLGDNSAAHKQMERSIQLLRALVEPALLIDPLIFHGMVLFLLGSAEAGYRELSEGLAYAQEAQEDWFVAMALLNRGYLASFAGATTEIYGQMQLALAIWRQQGGFRTIALALSYLSSVAIQLEHYADAHRFLDECLVLCQKIGDRWLLGTAYHHQAMLAQAQGDWVRAEAVYQKAIALFQEMQLLRDLCIAQVFLGEVYWASGEPQAARQTLLAGLRLALRIRALPTVLAALLDLVILPDFGPLTQRLLLVAFVRQHALKTQRLIRDAERLWQELTAQLPTAQLPAAQSEAIEVQASQMNLEALVAGIVSKPD
ncbi:MAG: helix-turn-helix domain-containing protein [Caldilineaceae bacterium]